MAELFIELFSEEIPAKLQIDARKKIKQMFEERLKKKKLILNQVNLSQLLKDLFFLLMVFLKKLIKKKRL